MKPSKWQTKHERMKLPVTFENYYSKGTHGGGGWLMMVMQYEVPERHNNGNIMLTTRCILMGFPFHSALTYFFWGFHFLSPLQQQQENEGKITSWRRLWTLAHLSQRNSKSQIIQAEGVKWNQIDTVRHNTKNMSCCQIL